ncbi:MAG TPA: hypothetical protein VM260_18800 [Pirellula sp.]|nr:hypothetical protein [Pirellula sp.]
MTDISSEKWLWIKGGLFVVIGFLSLGLLLMELTNAKQILLVLLSIWAFCRAYYFAFYVIENYIDVDYRFAGLIYLPQYIVQRWSGSIPTEPMSSQSGTTLSWYVFWPCVFLVCDIIGPGVYYPIVRGVNQREYIDASFAGAYATQIAFLAIVTSLARIPLKYSIPLSFTLLWVLAATFFFGVAFFLNGQVLSDVLPVFLLLTVLLAAVIGQMLLAKSLLVLSWCNIHEMSPPRQIEKVQNQLTIRYLLASTVAVALICVVFNATKDVLRLSSDYSFLVLLLAVLVGTLPAVGLLILLLRVTLSESTLKHEWKSIVLIAVCLGIFPFISHSLIQFPFSFHGRALPSITTIEILHWYCFVGGFVTSMTIVLLHARSQGIRLRYSSFDNQEN